MAMLCPICGLRELDFKLSEIQDFNQPSKRPEIVSIVCKSRGITEGLRENKCSYPRGSILFKFLVDIYWLRYDNEKTIMELLQRQEERLQTAVYNLYDELAAIDARRVRQGKENEKIDGLPGKLYPYEPPEK